MSTFIVFESPSALEFALLKRTQQLDLGGERHQGDFVNEQSPLMSQFEPSYTRGHGSSECAFRVSEQLGLDKALGERRRVERDETLLGARRVVVNGAGDQFLAGSRFALNQHGAVHRGDQFQRRKELLHGAVAADDAVEAEAAAQLRAQLCVLQTQPLLVDRGAYHPCELRELKRLDQEVDGAVFDRLYGLGDPAEARHDDGLDIGIPADGAFQNSHAAGVGQVKVDHQTVVRIGLEALDGRRGVRAFGHGEAAGFERLRKRLPQVGIVFDDQDRALGQVGHRRVGPTREPEIRSAPPLRSSGGSGFSVNTCIGLRKRVD